MTIEFLNAVSALCGPKAVKTDPRDLESYSVDWRRRYFGKPLAAVFPANTKEVAEIVKLANAFKIALVPQGGNTGLSGGATPDASGTQVVLCLTKLKSVRDRDPDNKTLTVEAGVTLREVQILANEMGLFFPLSLGSEGSATIGGNLATNAGGTAVLRYGNARDLCLGIEVVTANGEIWNGLRGLRKDNTGYDLRDLFIGSEGTLGIITSAVLKLFPKPLGVSTALIQVEGPKETLRLLNIAQRRCDFALTGFEYMSAQSTQLVCQRLPEIAKPTKNTILRDGKSSDCVLIEISHPQSETFAAEMLEAVFSEASDAALVLEATVSKSVAQTQTLWHLRDSITMASAEDGIQIKLDIALPISVLCRFISEMDAELLSSYPGVRLVNFGHFGDGNLHYNVAAPESLAVGCDAGERKRRYAEFIGKNEEAIRRQIHDKVVSMNGSISAEHGLGVLRRDEARRYKSPIELKLMETIKQALDPNGILNPDKVLEKKSI